MSFVIEICSVCGETIKNRYELMGHFHECGYGKVKLEEVMTNPTDEQLSEFVAELCRLDPSMRHEKGLWYGTIPNGEVIYFTPDNMFQYVKGAIIRHLIEEEMEQRQFNWALETIADGWRCEFSQDKTQQEFNSDPKTWFKIKEYVRDKNKTRAVALAAWRALGGEV